MDTGDIVRALADRQAITDGIYRYCRAVDRLDVALGHSVFHEDATADYGRLYVGPARPVIDLICHSHRQLLHHSHQVSNILIALDGDRAGSEAYVTASLRGERDGQAQHLTVWSRYVDRWSRRGGRWAIDARVVVTDFDEVRAATPMQRHDIARRDRDDPSYAVLGVPDR